jgi:hypothetical protein
MLEFQQRASPSVIEADRLKRAEIEASTILVQPLVDFIHRKQNESKRLLSLQIPFRKPQYFYSATLPTGNKFEVSLTEKGPKHTPFELTFSIEAPNGYSEMYKFKPCGAIMLSADNIQGGKYKRLSADELKSKRPLFRDVVTLLQTA